MNKYQVKVDFSNENGAFSHFNNAKKGLEQWCMNFNDLEVNTTILKFRNLEEKNFFVVEYKKYFPNLMLEILE